MSIRYFAASLIFSVLSLAHAELYASECDYLVVSLLKKGDPYEKAGAELIGLRNAKGTRASLDDRDSLLAKFKRLRPEHVAFIARPKQIDINFANQVLDLATSVDEDPFVDFSYGVITGRTPSDAVRLARAGKIAESMRRKPTLGILGVAEVGAVQKSSSQDQVMPLRGLQLPMTWAHVAQNDSDRDQKFIGRALSQFQSKSIFAFAGHGYPDRVVGGATSTDLQGRDFSGAFVFNIACYTGVTSDWFETDYKTATIQKKNVSLDESFCLRMIETGVAGYVAYACPRPAGPEMFADMLEIASEGISIGEQRRRHANSVILTYLSQDDDEVGVPIVRDGQDLRVPQSAGEIVRRMSTGSLLFGDPATVPFRKVGKAYPVSTRTKRKQGKLRVEVLVEGPLWHWFCSDQLEQTCMKIESQIQFAGRLGSIEVDKLPFGVAHPVNRIAAAIESHRGQQSLHIKATFDRPGQNELVQYMRGVSSSFIIDVDKADGPDQFVHVASVGTRVERELQKEPTHDE